MKGSKKMVKSKRTLRKRIMNYIAATAIGVTCMPSLGSAATTYASVNISELSAGNSDLTEMRGLSASQLVAEMGAGWNLGNSLDSEYNETYWGNPTTTKEMIDTIAARGFKTLRIPVRWDDNYSNPSSYIIKSEYMDRVETVVNYGLENGMYVIINVHHNDLQTMVSTDGSVQQRVKNELSSIWKQVGERFKNYGDRLIFETINEPRAGEDWNGNTSYYNCVNEYNEAGRAAIRGTGGNNSSRLIMMPTYCASADSPKISAWKKLSDDAMIAVSIHAYLPFDFAFEGNGHSNWTDSDYYSLSSLFRQLNTTFISKGLPVVIGEFGATGKDNIADRETYAKIYATFAKKYHMPCIWWDNNLFGKGAEQFGIFNRSSLSFTYGGIADAIINVYKGNDDDDGDDDDNNPPLFNGSSSASNWGQAVSVSTSRYGGFFDPSTMKQGGYFYVEYSGTKDQVDLILQSLSGGNNWSKVSISESGSVNGHYFAKFSYENCVAAFGADFSGLLDRIYVGATDKPITVYSLIYNHE
jgi:endoglucanase